MSKDFKVKNGLQVTTNITASGNISSSGTITANSFVGNLSSISNLITNDGANRVLTSDNDGTLSAESAMMILHFKLKVQVTLIFFKLIHNLMIKLE